MSNTAQFTNLFEEHDYYPPFGCMYNAGREALDAIYAELNCIPIEMVNHPGLTQEHKAILENIKAGRYPYAGIAAQPI